MTGTPLTRAVLVSVAGECWFALPTFPPALQRRPPPRQPSCPDVGPRRRARRTRRTCPGVRVSHVVSPRPRAPARPAKGCATSPLHSGRNWRNQGPPLPGSAICTPGEARAAHVPAKPGSAICIAGVGLPVAPKVFLVPGPSRVYKTPTAAPLDAYKPWLDPHAPATPIRGVLRAAARGNAGASSSCSPWSTPPS